MAENQDSNGEGDAGGAPEGGGRSPAEAVIAAFGGIRPMAHKLNIAVSTVQGWKNRGVIPEGRHAEIREAAQRHDVALDEAVLQASGDGARPGDELSDSARDAPRKAPWSTDETEHAVAAEAEAAAAAESDTVDAEVVSESGATPASPGDGGAAPAGESARGDNEGGSAPPGPPPQEPRRAGGWLPGMLIGAAIFAIAVGGTVVSRDAWLPLVDEESAAAGAPSEARVAQIEERIEERTAELSGGLERLDDRLSAMEQRAVDDPERLEALAQEAESATARLMEMSERLEQASARMETGAQRIDQVSSRLERLEARVNDVAESAAPADAVEDLSGRLGQMEEQVEQLAALGQRVEAQEALREMARTVAAREVGRAVAVANLRDALRFSTPFEAELEAAREVVADDSEVAARLDALQPFAARGIPTRDQLVGQFEQAAREAVTADAEQWVDNELVGGILRRLGDVVTVRPVGEDAEGAGAGAVLARAEARLRAGDLDSAVEAVENLQGAARERMEGWLEQAQARLMAERAVAGLGARLAQAAPRNGANGG